jgi:hypothetical protein
MACQKSASDDEAEGSWQFAGSVPDILSYADAGVPFLADVCPTAVNQQVSGRLFFRATVAARIG